MIFIQVFDEFSLSKLNRPRCDAASHLGLCCLPMSHKRDARLKCLMTISVIRGVDVRNIEVR